MTEEPKAAIRQKTFLKGTLYYDNRRASIECVVRDMSDTGARLTFDNPANVPDNVELFIPHKQQTLRARVRGTGQTRSASRSRSIDRSSHGALPTPSCSSASRRWKWKSPRSNGWLQNLRQRCCRTTSTWRSAGTGVLANRYDCLCHEAEVPANLTPSRFCG
jgi:hypothetical protein